MIQQCLMAGVLEAPEQAETGSHLKAITIGIFTILFQITIEL